MSKEKKVLYEQSKPVESREPEFTLKILQDLVRIPSYVDSDHNEREVIDYIKKIFETDGYYQVVEQPVEGSRSNLIIYDGTPPKIILFGHMDTVAPTATTTDSFSGVIIDGKMYGRGTVDMKAGVAIAISSALRLKPQGLAIVLTADEEFDFKGAFMLQKDSDFDPEYVINLEPTSGEILNGCRGITEFTMLVKGKSAHASRKDLGISAILKTYDFYRQLEENLKQWDIEGVRNSLNFSAIEAGSLKEENLDEKPVIARAANKVPDVSYPLFEIRIANPHMTQEDLEKLLQETAEKTGVNYKYLKIKFFLGSMIQATKENLKPFEDAVLAAGLPVKYLDINNSGFYEVQMVQRKWNGIYIIFGPGPHTLAHAPEEYVEVDSVNNVQRVIDIFLRNNLGK